MADGRLADDEKEREAMSEQPTKVRAWLAGTRAPYAILLGVLLACFSIYLYLNFLGFCFTDKRFLSDQEKTNIVVREVLAAYPRPGETVNQVSVVNGVQVWTRVKVSPENLIPYRDINEFFSQNPDCCKVTKVYHDGEGLVALDFVDRICGRVSDFVEVKYFVRYRDEQGVERKKSIRTFPAISNCGKTVTAF